jgi:FtsP/CotA-like multicopper oxidase with cupredoxin domain
MDNADPRSSAVESDVPATPPTEPPASRSWAQSFRRSRWIVIVFVIVVELAFAGAIAAAVLLPTFKIGTPGTADPSAPASSMVHLTEFKVEPSDLTVATGGTLKVMNAGTMAHNLAVKDAALATPMLNPGGTADLALGGLRAGTYTVYCQVPGHEQAGMSATLRVIEPSGAATTQGSPSATAPSMTAAQMDEAMARSMKAFPAKTQGVGGQMLAPTVEADGTKQFDLTAEVVKWEVSPGRLVDAWTYNGTVPGPTIRVNPGDKVKVVLHNRLPESTSIHFHGILTPNSMDGVPGFTQSPVEPGKTFVYNWTAQATPAVGMYHSHEDAVKQVPNGLAGAFLNGDEPLPSGVKVAQEQIMMLDDSGTIGLGINGKSFPATAPVVAHLGDWIEVHYMNEGQMIHPMHLHGTGQLVIAEDGYPVPQPYRVDTLSVAPGQRFTVLIHAENPGTWAWHCHIFSHAETDQGMVGMVTARVVQQ